VDLTAWHDSLDAIEAWEPVSLFLTHFGPVTPARAHLHLYRDVLRQTADRAARSLALDLPDEARAASFRAEMLEDASRVLSASQARALETFAPFDQIWAGLARYLRKSTSSGGLGDGPPLEPNRKDRQRPATPPGEPVPRR
jgi:hypothetical protein